MRGDCFGRLALVCHPVGALGSMFASVLTLTYGKVTQTTKTFHDIDVVYRCIHVQCSTLTKVTRKHYDTKTDLSSFCFCFWHKS